MKRTVLLMATALLFSTAAAVVGGPDPGEGEMAITSTGSSASASTAVGPNGTEWHSEVEMVNRSPNVTEGDRVENISHSKDETTFSGHIQAPTPCHVIDQETEKLSEQSYRMNVQTVEQDIENESQVCTQQVVIIEYEASFEAASPYSLEIQHNNQTVDTLENDLGDEPAEEPSGSIFDAFFNWLGNLF